MSKVKITVEIDGQSQVYEYSHCEVILECGLIKEYGFNYSSGGKPINIMPNGHRRLLIKAWSGCPDWESFIPAEER